MFARDRQKQLKWLFKYRKRFGKPTVREGKVSYNPNFADNFSWSETDEGTSPMMALIEPNRTALPRRGGYYDGKNLLGTHGFS
jgi:hypothetical protein